MKLKHGKKITIQKRDEDEAMEEEATGYGSVWKKTRPISYVNIY